MFLSPEIRFAVDSPLEEAGFEPMVTPRSALFEGLYGRAGDPSSEGYGFKGLLAAEVAS